MIRIPVEWLSEEVGIIRKCWKEALFSLHILFRATFGEGMLAPS